MNRRLHSSMTPLKLPTHESRRAGCVRRAGIVGRAGLAATGRRGSTEGFAIVPADEDRR